MLAATMCGHRKQGLTQQGVQQQALAAGLRVWGEGDLVLNGMLLIRGSLRCKAASSPP